MSKYENLQRFDDNDLREMEYLLTNGIGGYASSTVTGRQTRKYHGVLIASLNPPVERFMGLSKLCDTVTIQNKHFDLNHYDQIDGESSESVCPISFQKDWSATQIYHLDQLLMEKSHILVKGKNRAIVKYSVSNKSDNQRALLQIRPEFSLRDHHEVNLSTDAKPDWAIENGILKLSQKIKSQVHTPGMKGNKTSQLHASLQIIGEKMVALKHRMFIEPIGQDKQWVGPYRLANEVERGLENSHFQFSPLKYLIEVAEGEAFTFYVVTELSRNELTSLSLEQITSDILMTKQHYEDRIRHLDTYDSEDHTLIDLAKVAVVAADDFIVHRKSTGKLSILAGYPWFTDWGRDSMISLPGLTLAAGELERFKTIFETFASYMKSGILPNMFPDDGEEPIYNTVDATLWMPIAMHRYVSQNGCDAFASEKFLPILRDIINNYEKGTLNNTFMDRDHLIWSGDESTQLTWMDVKVNGWVVTPRHGKAVEINVLWYNCLMIAASLATLDQEKALYLNKANQIKDSFVRSFWNDQLACLYDVVREDEKLAEIRPNQIFAISLPYPLFEGEQAQSIFKTVNEHLFIGSGLRSLSPSDPNYQGQYLGDVLQRDGAYHRGTGWGWLLGPYLDAYWQISRQDEASLQFVKSILIEAGENFKTLCIGQYPENFDGNAPHHGRGCMAQAWSVAEYLRWAVEALKLESKQ